MTRFPRDGATPDRCHHPRVANRSGKALGCCARRERLAGVQCGEGIFAKAALCVTHQSTSVLVATLVNRGVRLAFQPRSHRSLFGGGDFQRRPVTRHYEVSGL